MLHSSPAGSQLEPETCLTSSTLSRAWLRRPGGHPCAGTTSRRPGRTQGGLSQAASVDGAGDRASPPARFTTPAWGGGGRGSERLPSPPPSYLPLDLASGLSTSYSLFPSLPHHSPPRTSSRNPARPWGEKKKKATHNTDWRGTSREDTPVTLMRDTTKEKQKAVALEGPSSPGR